MTVGLPMEDRDQWPMFFLFFLFALAFNFDLILGPYAILRIHDTFDSGFFEFFIRGGLFLKYGLFGWDPHYAGGMPSFANQFPPYYPLALLSTVLPPWLVYSLMCLGLMTLAGYGMYRMLAGFFQVSRPIAVFGGLVFSISASFFVVQALFNYVFPIFFVWSTELVLLRLGLVPRALRVFGLVGLALLSYPVISLPFFPIFHLALVVAYGRQSPDFKRLILGTIMVWTGYVLLFAPLLYTLYEYVPLAQRTYDCDYRGLLDALVTFGAYFRHDFLSQPGALVILCGLPLLRPSRRLWLAVALAVIFSTVSAFFYSQFRCLLSDSFLMRMDLAHFNLLVPACSTLVAALILEELLSAPIFTPRLAAVVIILALIYKVYRPETGVAVLVMGFSLLAWMRMKDSPETPVGSATLKAMLALAVFAGSLAAYGMYGKQRDDGQLKFINNVPYAKIYGNHPELAQLARERDSEVFRVGSVDVHPSVAQSYGLETVDQRGPLSNKYYKQFIKAVILPQLKDPEDENWFDTYWYDIYLTARSQRKPASQPNPPRTAASWNLPLLMMLNVKYLITNKPIEGLEAFADLSQKAPGEGIPFKFLKDSRINRDFAFPLLIYRFREPFTRGYLAKKPVVLADRREVLRQLTQQTLADLKEKVFFAAADLPSPAWSGAATPTKGVAETLRLVEYSPDRLVFAGVAGSPAFLVVTDNYDPHWRAEVNRQQARVYRANHAFQAVFIKEAGPFRVVLTYHDPLVWWLHLATLLGLGLFVACAFLGGKPDPPGTMAAVDHLPGGPAPQSDSPRVPKNAGVMAPHWLMGLSGLAMALIFAAYYVYKGKLPATELNKIYFLIVVPGVGVLLSLWASVMARRW